MRDIIEQDSQDKKRKDKKRQEKTRKEETADTREREIIKENGDNQQTETLKQIRTVQIQTGQTSGSEDLVNPTHFHFLIFTISFTSQSLETFLS